MPLMLNPSSARSDAGLTQSDAAKALGVSRATVVRWEGATSAPNAKQLNGMVDLYGLGTIELAALVAWFGSRS